MEKENEENGFWSNAGAFAVGHVRVGVLSAAGST